MSKLVITLLALAVVDPSIAQAAPTPAPPYESSVELLATTSTAQLDVVVADTNEPKSALRPEAIVRFKQGGPACLERNDLQKMILLSMRGEETKTQALLLEHGGSCVMLSPTVRYKIISVEEPDPDLGFGLVEIVGEGVIAGRGAWAFSLGAEEVKNSKRK